jgi:cytidylate kinase
MLERQHWAKGSVVAEGRDIGTVISEVEVKIYLMPL